MRLSRIDQHIKDEPCATQRALLDVPSSRSLSVSRGVRSAGSICSSSPLLVDLLNLVSECRSTAVRPYYRVHGCTRVHSCNTCDRSSDVLPPSGVETWCNPVCTRVPYEYGRTSLRVSIHASMYYVYSCTSATTSIPDTGVCVYIHRCVCTHTRLLSTIKPCVACVCNAIMYNTRYLRL
jgi:hypothetical protein